MPLRTSYAPLFSTTWVNELKGSVELSQVATITIVNPKASQRVYDPITDTWNNVATTVYTGRARVQPLRSANPKVAPGNETQVQTYLFSLPIDTTINLDFRPGFIATVTVAELNPALLGYQFVLSEIGDSSNPIERTLMFTVNQETKV